MVPSIGTCTYQSENERCLLFGKILSGNNNKNISFISVQIIVWKIEGKEFCTVLSK